LGERVLVYKRDFEDKQMEQAPTTPGMKYRHYSPNCAVILVEALKNSQDTHSLQMTRLKTQYQLLCKSHDNVGVLLVNPSSIDLFPIQLSLGSNAKQVAQSLFSKLRDMEALGVSVILVQGILEEDEGLAVMNRLRKCSSLIV
jgi:L-threonylcarbamoyladenylate synthase